jgi:hypothetical protein
MHIDATQLARYTTTCQKSSTYSEHEQTRVSNSTLTKNHTAEHEIYRAYKHYTICDANCAPYCISRKRHVTKHATSSYVQDNVTPRSRVRSEKLTVAHPVKYRLPFTERDGSLTGCFLLLGVATPYPAAKTDNRPLSAVATAYSIYSQLPTYL